VGKGGGGDGDSGWAACTGGGPLKPAGAYDAALGAALRALGGAMGRLTA
jgi:hypothetical protein